MSQADRDFAAIYPILEKQLDAMGETPTYLTASAEAKRLDHMSMLQWLQTYVPGGAQSQLGRLIFEAYRNEYGREPSELSAVNLVNMLARTEEVFEERRPDQRARLFGSALYDLDGQPAYSDGHRGRSPARFDSVEQPHDGDSPHCRTARTN